MDAQNVTPRRLHVRSKNCGPQHKHLNSPFPDTWRAGASGSAFIHFGASPSTMTAHTPPLWDDFMHLSDQAALEVRFPSEEIAFSDRLLSLLRLSPGSRPENFGQWHELGIA